MAELRKYGVATTIIFPLVTRDAADLKSGATFAAGDVKLMKDEGAFANTTNLPADEGNGWYSLALTVTEMEMARGGLIIIDQSSPKVWEDWPIPIETYGHASAQHEFDLDDANPDANVVQWRGTTPNILLGGRVDADAVLSAAGLATDAAQEIADEVLKRAISNVEPGAGFRTLYGAVAALVNKHEVNAAKTDIVIYKSDDTTILVTIPITTDSTLNPIKSLDPP